ncbi:hypothetical protein KJ865_03510, partial [Myxococcota bacterium]|nr:hypothetical protein [Myxococcota bacterium]
MTLPQFRIGIDIGASNVKLSALQDEKILLSTSRELNGPTRSAVESLLEEAMEKIPVGQEWRLGVTGVGREIFCEENPALFINEVMSAASAAAAYAPRARTVIDMGGEFTKWIQLDKEGTVSDFATNGLCAAGAGAFLEQQAGRLQLNPQTLGDMASKAEKGSSIAGRCSVFAKSDMIHLQQKGTPVDEIAYGLCLALIRTFSATVLQGRKLLPPVVLVGGGARNKGLVRAIREIFALGDDDIILMKDPLTAGSLGAAMLAELQVGTLSAVKTLLKPVEMIEASRNTIALSPLGPYRDREAAQIEQPQLATQAHKAWLGLDVGSVSTNLVLLDEDFQVIHGIYLPTKGRPVEVIRTGLDELAEKFGTDLEILGCGATGSGRHLAAALVGADVVKNEITAQMVSSVHYFPMAETIFEIGGQDSKYISVKKGSFADFEMNKICAAGTGSFLEEQATRLGINIIGEFGDLASRGTDPSDLGNQCTVFMDTELVAERRRGTSLE